jgi:hypothetical protein
MGFAGTLVGGSGTTLLNCFWSGSEDGILHVASNSVVNQTFMQDSLISTTTGSDNSGTPATENEPAELAMADNAQPFSRTTTPSLTNGTEVGVITFKFVRNPGLWTGTNVTDSEIVQALLGKGITRGGTVRAVFDGNPADTNDYVFISGRDSSSGTRVNAFGNTGFGILTTPAQMEMNSSGVMQPLSFSTNRSGVITTNYTGDFGFSSGGTLAGTMGASTTASTDFVHTNTGYSVVAYLGTSDAKTAETAGAVDCSYNGVSFSTNSITEGNYTFWGNEYIYAALNDDATALQVYNLIATNTPAFCDGTIAISLPTMHTTRGGPTSAPAHN